MTTIRDPHEQALVVSQANLDPQALPVRAIYPIRVTDGEPANGMRTVVAYVYVRVPVSTYVNTYILAPAQQELVEVDGLAGDRDADKDEERGEYRCEQPHLNTLQLTYDVGTLARTSWFSYWCCSPGERVALLTVVRIKNTSVRWVLVMAFRLVFTRRQNCCVAY